ncbi:GDP-mannose 4,6-dehydratase [Pendulispora rubella]|uniref:GDP-mannose 4,6-dehydratase n=1 Tax=Pendulispora rubella TaxID=2741070 RepID=A0ABZ2LGW1_9BACT
MRILVTGADGFVGKHLCRHLRDDGADVFELRGPETPGPANIDLTDGEAVARAVHEYRPEGVVHLAGFSSVAQSHADPARAFAVNVLGTVNILAALRKSAPAARTVVVSSGEVYGKISEGQHATETSPLAPSSPYAASKAAAETAAGQFFRSYGLPVVVARPFNHLGAGQAAHFVVPSFARQLLAIRTGKIEARLEVGNLEPVRDFSHVRDVVEAYRLLLLRGAPGEAYNVGSGTGRSILSVLGELRNLVGVDVEPTVSPERFRPAEIPYLVGDAAKLRALGWQPKRTVTEALRDVIEEVTEL